MRLRAIVVIVLAVNLHCVVAQPKKISGADLLRLSGVKSMIGKNIGELIAMIEPEYRTLFPFSRRPDKPSIHIDGFTFVYPNTDSTDTRVQILVDSLKYIRKGNGRESYSFDVIAKEKISGLNVFIQKRMTDNDVLFYNEYLQGAGSRDNRGLSVPR